ncbi:MAG: hypothetical protein JXQ83_12825 [Candidatus Glassbacteria bacterium]|nr:hypothetical protein [Candidatus Glassbacteria bacterium]
MKLKLDGLEIDPGTFGAETLSGLIQTVERSLAPARVIISMNLDGRPLGQQEEHARAAEGLDTLESLDINTQRVDELVRNTLETLTDYLPRLIEQQDDCVILLQGEDEKQGHTALGRLIDGLLMVSTAWKGIAQTIKIPDYRPEELIPDIQGFNSILHSIAEAQEADDIVRLCDLLQFELGPTLETWLEKAGEIRDLEASHNVS